MMIADGYCTTGYCDYSIRSRLEDKATSYEWLLAEFLVETAHRKQVYNRIPFGVWVIGDNDWLNRGFNDHVVWMPFLAGERNPDYRVIIAHVKESVWSAGTGRALWKDWLEEGGMTVFRPYADERQFANHANYFVERMLEAVYGEPLDASQQTSEPQAPSEVLQSTFDLPAAYYGTGL